MKTLNLVFKGSDSWDRPVYECEAGTLYVDVSPNSSYEHLHTKSNNEYDGEPDWPIDRDVAVNFIPNRIRW